MRRLLSVALVLTLLVGGGFTAFDHLAPQESAQLAAELEHALSKLERKTVMVDGLEIVYLEGGSGEPLVLVHGFGADKDNFTRVARGLTAHYRVIIPDLPGFGESSRPLASSFHIPEQSEHVHRFVATLGIDSAHFGGSSMGGWIIADYAARYPQQALSLWLLAPGGVSSADPSPMQKTYAVTGVSPLIAQSPDDFARIINLVMADPPYMPYSIKRVLGERAARDAKLHTEIFEQIAKDEPLEKIATRITAPSLIVWGEKDQVLDVSGAHILHQVLKGSQLIVMPDVGHLPMLERPKQAAADYLSFRASLPAAP
jgi:pimeloyl-ACP methyl ester carboxylesterase